VALWGLPRAAAPADRTELKTGYLPLLGRWTLVRMFFCAGGSFAVFSTIFNYLPFRLGAPPFSLSTEKTTLLYLTYMVGFFIGPVAGRISNRVGGGNTLIAGSLVFAGALGLLLLPSITATVLGLLVTCAGFFTIHAAAVGALNRKLTGGQGRANALYVLFYYIGGWLGISGAGVVYQNFGWTAVVGTCGLLLIIPLSAGIAERRWEKDF